MIAVWIPLRTVWIPLLSTRISIGSPLIIGISLRILFVRRRGRRPCIRCLSLRIGRGLFHKRIKSRGLLFVATVRFHLVSLLIDSICVLCDIFILYDVM